MVKASSICEIRVLAGRAKIGEGTLLALARTIGEDATLVDVERTSGATRERLAEFLRKSAGEFPEVCPEEESVVWWPEAA